MKIYSVKKDELVRKDDILDKKLEDAIENKETKETKKSAFAVQDKVSFGSKKEDDTYGKLPTSLLETILESDKANSEKSKTLLEKLRQRLKELQEKLAKAASPQEQKALQQEIARVAQMVMSLQNMELKMLKTSAR